MIEHLDRFQAELLIRTVAGGAHPVDGDMLAFTTEGWRFKTPLYSGADHEHDDRYYREDEADALFANIAHVHDDRYYTEEEVDALFGGLAAIATSGDISDLNTGANGVLLAGTGGTGERLANGGPGTVLRGGTTGGGSTGMTFGQIDNSHVAVGANIATSKISGLAAVAMSGSASDLGTGTLPDGRFPATLPAASAINLTAINATNIASGSLADARLSSNVPLKASANTFTENQTVSKAQNGSTLFDIVNTTDNTAALAGFRVQGNNNAGGSSRRLKFSVYADLHSVSLFAGKMVLGSDNIPKLLFNPSAGTTTGSDETVDITFGTTANILSAIRKQTTNRKILSIFSSVPTDTGGDGVIYIANAGTVPSSNPSGGGILYATAGALKWLGSSGTLSTLGAA